MLFAHRAGETDIVFYQQDIRRDYRRHLQVQSPGKGKRTEEKRYSGHKTLLPFSIAKTQQRYTTFPQKIRTQTQCSFVVGNGTGVQTYNEKEGRYVSTDCSQLIGA